MVYVFHLRPSLPLPLGTEATSKALYVRSNESAEGSNLLALRERPGTVTVTFVCAVPPHPRLASAYVRILLSLAVRKHVLEMVPNQATERAELGVFAAALFSILRTAPNLAGLLLSPHVLDAYDVLQVVSDQAAKGAIFFPHPFMLSVPFPLSAARFLLMGPLLQNCL